MSESARAAVLTVSDGVANGTRDDASGDLAEALLRAAGFDVDARSVTPDERPEIETALVDTPISRCQGAESRASRPSHR